MARSCGEVLVALLRGYGVDTIFGIPGVHTLELYRGLSNSDIRHVTSRHEQGAGFMADGYARAGEKPGVCFVIAGPGVTNTLTAMGQALGDSIPILIISSVTATYDLAMGEGRLHALQNQRGLMSGVTRWSHTLMRPDELPKVLARAFAQFAAARPGPVHIEIPIDVLAAPADHVLQSVWPLPSPPGPAPAAIREAGALLEVSKSPIIVAGGGALLAGAELRAVAERLDAPVVNTVRGKGVLPYSHPLSVGGSVTCKPVRSALESADVVLAVGTEFGETDYDYEFSGDLRLSGKLIRIDVDAQQLTRNMRCDVPIFSDSRLALQALHDFGVSRHGAGDGRQRTLALRQALAASRNPLFERFFSVLQRRLPEAIVVGDSMQLSYYAWMYHEAEMPRRYFHSASGFGTLGYGIPGAIGAKVARPNRAVVCLVGDGGAQFTIGELASAAEQRVPVIFLIWNNSEYREIATMMQERGVEPIGTAKWTVDFCAVAKGFGCEASRCETFEDLERQLMLANGQDKPWVIEVIQSELERQHGVRPERDERPCTAY